MGTDIRICVEKLNQQSKWESIDEWKLEDGDLYETVVYEKRFFSDRNYDVFSILGNVRNGANYWVFEDSGYKLEYLSDSRGIPEDSDERVKNYLRLEGSCSYLTLPEILAFDWQKTVIINDKEVKYFKLFKPFISQINKKLKAYKECPEKIRFVFGFS